MDKDRIEGSAEQAKGKVKEVVGKVTGDSKLEGEGKADQVAGKVQNQGHLEGEITLGVPRLSASQITGSFHESRISFDDSASGPFSNRGLSEQR